MEISVTAVLAGVRLQEKTAVENPNKEALQSDSPTAIRPESDLNVWSCVAAAVLAAFYCAASIYIASRHLFWFDELLTVHVAWLPDWMAIWKALAHAADGMSPTYDTVVRISAKLFGHNEVAARLPSALAMAAGLLLTFDCARRLTDGLHGLIALSVVTCSSVLYDGFGYLARSYAIYFMFSAISLWVWVHTRDDKRSSAILFGVVLFLGVLMHYYAVLLLVPYAVWEVSHWKPWQPPSPKLIAGILGVVVAAAILSPVALSFSRRFSAGYWAPPSFLQLRATFSEFFPDGLFLLGIAILWIILAGTKDGNVVLQPMQPGESIGWLFLCIPLAGFILAKLKTNAFIPRYFVGTLPGIAVALSCLLWRRFRHACRISLGIFLLLVTWGVAKQMNTVQHPESVNPFGEPFKMESVLSVEDPVRNEGKRFVVFSTGGLYIFAQYYSKHPEQCILLLPPRIGRGWSTTGLAVNLAPYYPMQFWKLDDLKQHARETALIWPAQGTLDAMEQAGFKVERRFFGPIEVTYLQ